MGDIVRFPGPPTKDEWINGIAEVLKDCQKAAVVLQMDNGEYATAYYGADVADKMTLLGHIQADVMMQCVEATFCD